MGVDLNMYILNVKNVVKFSLDFKHEKSSES